MSSEQKEWNFSGVVTDESATVSVGRQCVALAVAMLLMFALRRYLGELKARVGTALYPDAGGDQRC